MLKESISRHLYASLDGQNIILTYEFCQAEIERIVLVPSALANLITFREKMFSHQAAALDAMQPIIKQVEQLTKG